MEWLKERVTEHKDEKEVVVFLREYASKDELVSFLAKENLLVPLIAWLPVPCAHAFEEEVVCGALQTLPLDECLRGLCVLGARLACEDEKWNPSAWLTHAEAVYKSFRDKLDDMWEQDLGLLHLCIKWLYVYTFVVFRHSIATSSLVDLATQLSQHLVSRASLGALAVLEQHKNRNKQKDKTKSKVNELIFVGLLKNAKNIPFLVPYASQEEQMCWEGLLTLLLIWHGFMDKSIPGKEALENTTAWFLWRHYWNTWKENDPAEFRALTTKEIWSETVRNIHLTLSDQLLVSLQQSLDPDDDQEEQEKEEWEEVWYPTLSLLLQWQVEHLDYHMSFASPICRDGTFKGIGELKEEAYVLSGQQHFEKEEWCEAAEAFLQAYRIHPHPSYHSRIREICGELDCAALQVDSDQGVCYATQAIECARVLNEKGFLEEARMLGTRAYVYLKMGECALAFDDIEQSIGCNRSLDLEELYCSKLRVYIQMFETNTQHQYDPLLRTFPVFVRVCRANSSLFDDMPELQAPVEMLLQHLESATNRPIPVCNTGVRFHEY